jgi:hypothetical protein
VVSAEERKSEAEEFGEFARSAWYFARASLAQILADEQQASMELLM